MFQNNLAVNIVLSSVRRDMRREKRIASASSTSQSDASAILEKSQISLQIPLRLAATKVKKILKSTKCIKAIDITEERFKPDDWDALSKGISKCSSVLALRFYLIEITNDNIHYITSIIDKNARIESVRFDNFTIVSLLDSFGALCEALKDAPKIADIEISHDNLTDEQIQMLKSTVESSVLPKRLSFFRDPTYIAHNQDQVQQFSKEGKKFIIAGLSDIKVTRSSVINRQWANAVKTSPTLSAISIDATISLYYWRIIYEALTSGQASVTKLKLDNTQLDTSSAPILKDLITNTNSIRKIVLRRIEISELGDLIVLELIRSTPIQSLKIEGIICFDEKAFIDAAYTNKNINQLRIAFTELPNSIYDMIYNCQHITDLRLRFTEFPDFPSAFKTRNIAYLTRLDLKEMMDTPPEIYQAVKLSTSLKEFTIEAKEKKKFRQIADILNVNSTLMKLSVSIPSKEKDFQVFAQTLTDHCSLKQLDILLHDSSNTNVLCQALWSNKALERLWIKAPTDLVNDEFCFCVSNLLSKNRVLRSMKLPISRNYEKEVTDMLAQLKNNDSLTELDLVIPDSVFAPKYVWSILKEVLQTNHALNRITASDHVKKKVAELTKKNKHCQDKLIKRTYSLIQMIKMRRNIFEGIFPLEIWVMVFKHIRHPGVNIDFSVQLVRRL